MSLILDALRKLERERDANEPPGVLVVGSVPWGETSRTRRLALVAAAAGVLGLAMLAGWLLRPVPRAPAAAAPSALPPVQAPATPAPTPPPATLPAAVVPAEPTAPPIRLSRPIPSPQPRVLPPSTATGSETPQPPAPAAESARPTAPAPADDLRLTAISQRDGKPVALINDRLVFEGDSFDGITVIRIGDAEVEVEVQGQRRVLRF
jgi:hypothetical protein